jgi:hypothetical protein
VRLRPVGVGEGRVAELCSTDAHVGMVGVLRRRRFTSAQIALQYHVPVVIGPSTPPMCNLSPKLVADSMLNFSFFVVFFFSILHPLRYLRGSAGGGSSGDRGCQTCLLFKEPEIKPLLKIYQGG